MATYLLIVQNQQAISVRVGARGEIFFPPAYYLYVGSAQKGLAARIARHYRRVKKRRWHIDYLLSRPEFAILEVWVSRAQAECELAQAVRAWPGVSLCQPGLGASDCRCPAHLVAYAGDLGQLRKLLSDSNLCPYHR